MSIIGCTLIGHEGERLRGRAGGLAAQRVTAAYRPLRNTRGIETGIGVEGMVGAIVRA